MSVVGQQPPPFFNRGPAPLARLAFFVALSLLMLVLDQRFHTLESVRQAVALIVYPLQRIAYAPVEGVQQGSGYFTTLVTLKNENDLLRQRQLSTANQLLRQEHLELENQRLRALLDMKLRQPAAGQMAEILYAARDRFARRVIIDKGSQQAISPGQVVVDEQGVIGQVTRSFPLLSEVTLITAKVTRVDRDTAYAFARILCEPIAGVERHGQVLVLGQHEAAPPAPPEPERQDRPEKGKRGKKREPA